MYRGGAGSRVLAVSVVGLVENFSREGGLVLKEQMAIVR
jgi:hypothetical protein